MTWEVLHFLPDVVEGGRKPHLCKEPVGECNACFHRPLCTSVPQALQGEEGVMRLIDAGNPIGSELASQPLLKPFVLRQWAWLLVQIGCTKFGLEVNECVPQEKQGIDVLPYSLSPVKLPLAGDV